MMFSKQLNKSEIKNVLIVSLSNIGDVVLTFPVIDVIREQMPEAKLSLIVGPKAFPLVEGNALFDNIEVFDKRQSLNKTLPWIMRLRKRRFDLAVDLRHTAIPHLAGARYKTSLFFKKMDGEHMRKKHLRHLRSAVSFDDISEKRYCLDFSEEECIVAYEPITDFSKIVIMSPGAADHQKRWSESGFARTADWLIPAFGATVVFIGDTNDAEIAERIIGSMKNSAVNFCGKTNLRQLSALISRGRLIVGNDSAPLHIASYLNVPAIALFGPTDPALYGPWSTRAGVLRRNYNCPACMSQKKGIPHQCLEAISADEVIDFIKDGFVGVLEQ